MELLRALAAFVETPGPEHGRLAALLDLEGVPDRAEHTELFRMQLYPYAAVYLSSDGRLGGEAADRIAGFWRALGATPPAEPDHLTTLLAAYASLAERESERDGQAQAWRGARHAFFWEHLASWLPAYLHRIRELASDVYAGWAAILERALEREAEVLGPPTAVALHMRSVSVLDAGALDDLPASIFAPARTGLIITRHDLAAVARSLGLGLRVGERPFILAQLLGQDPERVILGLAGLAERQAGAHHAAAPALAPACDPWAQRAERCAAMLHAGVAGGQTTLTETVHA